MPALTTRQGSSGADFKPLVDFLDRIIPPESSVPLRGKTILDREKQAEEMRKAVLPTLLQERVASVESAQVDARAIRQRPTLELGPGLP